MEGDINDKYQKCPILLKLSTVQQNEKKKTSRQNIKSRRFGKFYFQKTTYLQAKLKSSSLCPAVSAGGSQAKQDRN